MLSLSIWNIRQLLDRGDIESTYHGRRRLVVLKSVHAYADSIRVKPEAS